MKKLLLSLATIAMAAFGANAEVVLDMNKVTDANITAAEHTDADFSGTQNVYENWTGVSKISLEGYTLNCDQGTNEKTAVGFYTAKEGADWTLRFYKDNTMEVVAPEGVSMSKIEFKFSGSNYASDFAASTGNAALDGATLTWTGNANAVTFTNTGGKNARIVTITIFTDGEGGTTTPDDPVTPPDVPSTEGAAGAGTLADPFNIARAYDYCIAAGETPTAEKYYVKGYVVDGSISTQYGNATFTLADNKEGEGVTITAFRIYDIDGEKFTDENKIKNGDVIVVYAPLVNYKGTTPETNYGTLISINGEGTTTPDDPVTPPVDPELVTVSTVAAMNALEDNAKFLFEGNAVVSYHNGANLFIQDNTGAAILYGYSAETFDTGREIKSFKGTKVTYSELPEMKDLSDFVTGTVVGIDPVELTTATYAADYVYYYVNCKNVAIGEMNGRNNTLTFADGSELNGYQTFLNVTWPEAGTYENFYGIMVVYKGNPQFAFVSLDPLSDKASRVEAIEAAAAIFVNGNSIVAPEGSAVYNLNGMRVGTDNLAKGIYVVRTNNKTVKVIVK